MINSLKGTKGTIFDIQRYSIHDGPGIRTIVFLKGCPLQCPWCSNPESQKAFWEIEYARLDCVLCLRCVEACPEKALNPAEEGISFNREKCTMCGKCVEACLTGGIKRVGKVMTAGEVMQVVEKDRIFYERSGGGITLSGGEPLVQYEFASALLQLSKENGIHTCIETTGYQKWEYCWKVIRHVDLVLYDLKIWDSNTHREIVGVSNELILENAKKIAERGKEMIVRVPVIPGYTDSRDNLRRIAGFAHQIGVKELHLLPYHRLGEAKYQRLGTTYPLKGVKPHTKEEIELLANELVSENIKVQIGG